MVDSLALGALPQPMQQHYEMRQLNVLYAEIWTEPDPVQLSDSSIPVTHLLGLYVPTHHRGRGYEKSLLHHVVHDADLYGHLLTVDLDDDEWDQSMYDHMRGVYFSFRFEDLYHHQHDMVRWPIGR